MTELPNKPSELIRAALADLLLCEADPDRFTINMGWWLYKEEPDAPCFVCLAGAVMAQRLNGMTHPDFKPGHGEVYPDLFETRTANKLSALNEFRQGNLHDALKEMGEQLGDLPEYVNIPDYRNDHGGFHVAMEKLAATLAEHGL